jgi:hypothetical protein
MKMHFSSKVLMLQQCLVYRATIVLHYFQQTKALANKIPPTQTWAIVEVVRDVFSPIVSACVINQCHGYWTLLGALASTIKLHVQLAKERLELQA